VQIDYDYEHEHEEAAGVDWSDRLYLPMTRTIKASLLLFFLSLCGAAIFVTAHLRRQVPPPTPHELFVVVENQLIAFRMADYSSAYRQAASGVQRKFTVSQFEEMIRRDLGEMAKAKRIEFGFVKVNGSVAIVDVLFTGENGSPCSFLYSLSAERGSWKVNGVRRAYGTASRRHLTGLRL
jgi:hypothetical protein